MGSANTPYIAKNAAPLVNPTVVTPFLQVVPVTPNTSFVQQVAYVKYNGYASGGSGYSDNINNIRIAVRASGRVVGVGNTNFTPSILFGKGQGPFLAANFPTTVGTINSIAFNSASGNWSIDASLLWDPISGQINGTASGFGGSGGTQTTTSSTAITPVTGVVIVPPAANVSAAVSTGEMQIFFAVAGVFSAANAGNIAYLDQFEVESI